MLSSSPTYEHMRWPRKVSNILQTSVKFSKNPSGKTLQNCFIHKSSTRSGHWNEQNSYYSPPLVGKSHEEDTITTHFDWKKQKRILLVDRWEDQTATEDTTATRATSALLNLAPRVLSLFDMAATGKGEDPGDEVVLKSKWPPSKNEWWIFQFLVIFPRVIWSQRQHPVTKGKKVFHTIWIYSVVKVKW